MAIITQPHQRVEVHRTGVHRPSNPLPRFGRARQRTPPSCRAIPRSRNFSVEEDPVSAHLSCTMRWIFAVFLLGVSTDHFAAELSPFHNDLHKAKPVAYWSFDSVHGNGPKIEIRGPGRSPGISALPRENPALHISSGRRIILPDPGENSIYDFDNGDELTVEAMVNPTTLNTQAVIFSKGRTSQQGILHHQPELGLSIKISGRASRGQFSLSQSRHRLEKGDWHRWDQHERIWSRYRLAPYRDQLPLWRSRLDPRVHRWKTGQRYLGYGWPDQIASGGGQRRTLDRFSLAGRAHQFLCRLTR